MWALLCLSVLFIHYLHQPQPTWNSSHVNPVLWHFCGSWKQFNRRCVLMSCALWWTRWRLRNGWDSSEPGLAQVVIEAHLQLINLCLYSCVSLGADRQRLLAANCQRPAEDLDPNSQAINDTPTLGSEKRNLIFTCVQVNSSKKYQHWF